MVKKRSTQKQKPGIFRPRNVIGTIAVFAMTVAIALSSRNNDGSVTYNRTIRDLNYEEPTTGIDYKLNGGVLQTFSGQILDIVTINYGQNNCWTDALIRSGYPFEPTEWMQPEVAKKIVNADFQLVDRFTSDYASIDTSKYPAGTLIVINYPDTAELKGWGMHVTFLKDPSTGLTQNDNAEGPKYEADLSALFEGGLATLEDGRVVQIAQTYADAMNVEIYIPKPLEP